jgi:hypothetical protein
MRFKTMVGFLFAMAGTTAVAQQSQSAQIFAGYSLAHIAPCGTGGGSCAFEGTSFQGSVSPTSGTFNGWNGAASAFFTKSIGITADFAGYYGNLHYTNQSTATASTYTMLFGPTWAGKLGSISPFAHVLLGAEVFHFQSTTASGIAWAAGGGVDYILGKRMKVRLAQLDYIGFHQGSVTSGFRYSGGVVFIF